MLSLASAPRAIVLFYKDFDEGECLEDTPSQRLDSCCAATRDVDVCHLRGGSSECLSLLRRTPRSEHSRVDSLSAEVFDDDLVTPSEEIGQPVEGRRSRPNPH